MQNNKDNIEDDIEDIYFKENDFELYRKWEKLSINEVLLLDWSAKGQAQNLIRRFNGNKSPETFADFSV